LFPKSEPTPDRVVLQRLFTNVKVELISNIDYLIEFSNDETYGMEDWYEDSPNLARRHNIVLVLLQVLYTHTSWGSYIIHSMQQFLNEYPEYWTEEQLRELKKLVLNTVPYIKEVVE
jgi:hypothetical protein